MARCALARKEKLGEQTDWRFNSLKVKADPLEVNEVSQDRHRVTQQRAEKESVESS